jgi:hypothetical protein
MEFQLSRSLSRTFLSHDGISAITKPFTNFSFTPWNFGYHKAFNKLFFHTMEFWISQSLSRTFLSHYGILAITKPFTNFSFTRWNFGYHEAFRSVSRTFLIMELRKTHNLGEDSLNIYHKEYLHRIRLVKNLTSWFRAPFARKRVRSSLF